MSAANNPTNATYLTLNEAYDHFNRELFSDQLPRCLITMQRHRGAYGYFSPARFGNTANSLDVADEIALNPAHFGERETVKTLSTLVHEMVHLWQFHFGKQPRRGYHDRQWAEKMRSVGLIPSTTAAPGGKATGPKVSHYIEPGGLYEKAFASVGKVTLFTDRITDEDELKAKKKAASKTKYTCHGCDMKAWAKPDCNLMCGECEEPMSEDSDD